MPQITSRRADNFQFPSRVLAVTTSNTDSFSPSTLLVQTSGTIVVVPSGQTTAVTIPSVSGRFDVLVTKVLETGTTASNIFRLY